MVLECKNIHKPWGTCNYYMYLSTTGVLISTYNTLQFTGVESAQRFLVIVIVFSVIAVTNGFIKNVHFLKLTNSLD